MVIRAVYGPEVERLPAVFRPAQAATGNGVSDDHAAMQAELTAAAGRTWVVAPAASFYAISAPLVVPAGTTILLMPGVIIEQTTKYTPVFDILSVDDVVIEGGGALLRWTGSRAYTGGSPNVRGDDKYAYGAGVWCNGNRCRIRSLRLSGFTSGVYLSPWNGTILADTSKTDNVVEDIDVTACDFGLLFAGQVNLRFSGIRGTYALQSGSGNPPHLIYGSDAADNRNVTGSDCSASSGVGGHAYQFKAVNGGNLTGLLAYDCAGWLSENANTAVTFEGESFNDQGSAEFGSLYMQGTSQRCRVRFLVNLVASARTARVGGTDCAAVIKGRTRRSTSSDNYDVYVDGTRCEVDVDLINVQDDGTDYTTGYRCVGLAAGSGHRAVVRRALNTKYAVTVASGVTGCTVDLDPNQVVRSSSFTADSALSLVEIATTHVRQPRRALSQTISGAGITVRADAALCDSLHVTVSTNDAFTIQTPYSNGATTGARLLVLVHNNSGGAMGAITWTGFTFATAWTNPGATVRQWVEFARDGSGTWREIARSF